MLDEKSKEILDKIHKHSVKFSLEHESGVVAERTVQVSYSHDTGEITEINPHDYPVGRERDPETIEALFAEMHKEVAEKRFDDAMAIVGK